MDFIFLSILLPTLFVTYKVSRLCGEMLQSCRYLPFFPSVKGVFLIDYFIYQSIKDCNSISL